jgi:hypothetical protein
MGLNTDNFLDQPVKTQSHFKNDPISLSHSTPRYHTNIRLRAAAPQIVAKHRRQQRRFSSKGGKWVRQALKFSENLRRS